MEKSVAKGKVFAALLTDVSIAFDCLPHDLITVKLNAYGFSLSAAKLMQSYLSNRKQRSKVNKYNLLLMGRYPFWCSPRFHPRISAV